MNRIYMICLLTLFLQGCRKEDLCNCLESTGNAVTENRMLGNFNSMELNNNIDIILTPDSVEFVEITCGKNLVDGIKTEVSDGHLVIRNINKCNWLRDFKNKFVVNVHYKSLKQLTYNGSGNLTCSDTLKEDNLLVESWNGTGLLSFIFDGGEISLKLHTGPADIAASGKAGILYLYTAGNGYMKTAGLEANFVFITSKSTGDCEVFPKKELGAAIEYNGDIYYKGTPEVINQTITGNGKLIPF